MKFSAGVLPYRVEGGEVLVFVAHPGGPFWAKRDDGVWSVVKGEFDPDTEDARAAAAREFEEETGTPAPGDRDAWMDLGEVRQNPGKTVRAFAVESPATLAFVESNTCETEWPPRSGRTIMVPEVDRVEWMPVEQARRRLLRGQVPLVDRLVQAVLPGGGPDDRPRAE